MFPPKGPSTGKRNFLQDFVPPPTFPGSWRNFIPWFLAVVLSLTEEPGQQVVLSEGSGTVGGNAETLTALILPSILLILYFKLAVVCFAFYSKAVTAL